MNQLLLHLENIILVDLVLKEIILLENIKVVEHQSLHHNQHNLIDLKDFLVQEHMILLVILEILELIYLQIIQQEVDIGLVIKIDKLKK